MCQVLQSPADMLFRVTVKDTYIRTTDYVHLYLCT